MLDGNEKILCAVPSKDIISLYQNLNYHKADTIEGSLVLSDKYTSILSNVRYFAISDRNSNHNFYLYRKTLVQVMNHEIAINGQGAFWDEMQGSYIKDRRPNQVTPADTVKLILGYSRWEVDYGDQMLEEESLRRDMNFYYVSLLDALNTVYQTWQVDIEPYINIEGHKITRRYVKLYQQQGGNNGRRFVYGDNALTVTQQANEGSIFTALVGRGSGIEETDSSGNLTGGYSRKINFSDIEWSKAKGDPCDKPKGQEYVEWKESTAIYGYSDGKPRIGIVDFDNEKDPKQLLKETWAQLQQVGVPLVQFQATVGDVGYLNLGETVTIVRYDLNIKYQTRVTGIKWNRCDEAKSQITIGVKAIQSTADKIAGLQQSVSQANVNADEAKSTANHAIIDGKGAVVNYGPNEPTNPKEGDIWYDVQPDGTVVLKQYQNGQWVILIDDTTGEQIKNKVEAQQKELDKAVQSANDAVSKADGLVAQVGDANTNAQRALDTANQNKSDLEKAKADIQSTNGQLAGAMNSISQAQKDIESTQQSLQGVRSDLSSTKEDLRFAEENLSRLTEQAQQQGQTIVDIQKTQSGLTADIADVKGNVSSLQATANGLQSTVKDNQGNISKLQETSSKLQATVKDNQGNISKLQGTANILQSSVQNNKNDISNIRQTANEVQSVVTNMQNAGQNLIINSDFKQGNYHWNLNGWKISEDNSFRNNKIISKTQSGLSSANYNEFSATDLIPVQKGQTISIGVWVKASNIDSSGEGNKGALFGVNWYPDAHSGRNHWNDYWKQEDLGNHDWRFLKMEGIKPPTDSHFARAHFFITQNGTAQFALPIMVYGDTLPAWSPSPLDSATASDMSSVEQTIDGLKSTVQSNSGKISQVQQTADQLQSTVKNKVDISQFNQQADKLQSTIAKIGTYLQNGNFDDKDISKYWVPWDTTNDLSEISIDDTNRPNLNIPLHCLKIATKSSENKTDIGTKDFIPVNVNEGLQVKAWSYLSASNGNTQFKVYIHSYDKNNNEIDSWDAWFRYDNLKEWEQTDISWDSNSWNKDTVSIRVEVVLFGGGIDTYGAITGLKVINGSNGIASQFTQSLDGLESKIQDADGNISQLKQTADNLSSQIGNANNDISSLKQRADSIESNISNNKNNISDLKQTANSLQSNIQSKADISQVTQLSNVFQTVVQNIGAFLPDGDFSEDPQKYYVPWDVTKDYSNLSWNGNDPSNICIQINAHNGGFSKYITKDYIRINPNAPIVYTGKSWFQRGDGADGDFQAYLHYYDSNKNEINYQQGWYRYDGDGWWDFTITQTPPSNAIYLRIESTVHSDHGDVDGLLTNLALQNGKGSISSKISQMEDDINLRVQKGDLLSQINIQAGSTLIQSNKLFLDASSVVFSGNAFIPSAAITDLSADKITAGTLNAANVNIINLNVDKLVGDTTEFVRSGWTNAYGSHVQIDGGGMSITYGDWWTKFEPDGMIFKNGNEDIGGFTRIGMDGAPDWYSGLAFNAGGDAEFLAIGAKDYGNDNQNPVPAKLLWMRQGIKSYGYTPGWNFLDKVWMGQVGMDSIQYQDWNIHFSEITGSNGFTALTLVSGTGDGFYWGSDGTFGYVTNGNVIHNVRGSQLVSNINSDGTCQNWSSID